MKYPQTKTSHFHYVIIAAEAKTEAGFIGSTRLDLLAKGVEEAIQITKRLVPGREIYWVHDIVEHHDH